ncbi:spore germination protein [Alkalihalobacillus macyae]|uniref:spore germination protein n=1 Tax=Guptibacillus hwajinpoensis TaxID=208199 RepID=UPI00273A9F43|nr:spore germination protein [Alkalihalobacillus macyae]MDP4552839.1 spore germination protein [Alkalihalobacillus macyae]
MRIRRSTNKPPSTLADQIRLEFHNNNDLQYKRLNVSSLDITLVFMKDISDPLTIQKAIISPLLSAVETTGTVQIDGVPEILPIASIHKVTDFHKIITHIMDGCTIIIVKDQYNQNVYVVDTTKFIKRSPDEPINEPTISGSRDGFIECIQDNKALLRMHLKSKNLIFEKFTIGTEVVTYIYVVYMKGSTKETLVQEVRDRVSAIKVDYVTDGGILEQLLERNKLSVFPELATTQHPSKVANALLEGRVSILTDGSPTALIAPTTLNMLLQTPDDYYFKWIPASLIRLLSFVTAFISVLLPATYISLISFQHGLIPTSLAVSLSKTREGVPFPSVIEAFLMELTIEILREAGVRLPKPIGSTVSIVGAIVIGETAVSSGIVSPMMVMVISFTAICSFAIPNYQLSLALRTIRFFILFSAAILGIYGMLIAIFIVTTHLVKLRSFSVPYLEPFAPIDFKRWKDGFVRLLFRAEAKEDHANE